jgi:hypothetical protein
MRTMRVQPTIERMLVVVALALAIAGCALFEPDPDGTFSVVMPGREHIDPLAVDVLDRTGTVTAVIVAEGQFQEGVVAAPADPATLIVTWMGGLCDTRTTLTLETTLDTMQIGAATETRPGGCRAMGVMRSIAIRFDPPLAPGFVEFAPVLAGG